MIKRKKTGGRDFVKGKSGNPKGRPKTPEHMKKAKQMDKLKFQAILQKYIHCNIAELKGIIEKSKNIKSEVTALELVVIKVLFESIRKGDEKRLGFILDRLIGKVKEEIRVETDSYTGLIDLIALRKQQENND